MEEKKEKLSIPDGVVEAIVLDLAVGLLSHDKIAKKHKVSPDTITKISRLERERIGIIKKKIRVQVENATLNWTKKITMDMQELSQTIISEAFLKKKREAASFSQLFMALGIIIDKVQLLTGGATSRTDTVKMTSREDLLKALLNENTKSIEKSSNFESAKNKINFTINDKNENTNKEEIKKLLKNQAELLN